MAEGFAPNEVKLKPVLEGWEVVPPNERPTLLLVVVDFTAPRPNPPKTGCAVALDVPNAGVPVDVFPNRPDEVPKIVPDAVAILDMEFT